MAQVEFMKAVLFYAIINLGENTIYHPNTNQLKMHEKVDKHIETRDFCQSNNRND